MKYILAIILTLLCFQAIFAQTLSSHFVTMEDGVNLAVDVHLPEGYKDEALPVLIQFERYWRSSISKKEPQPKLYGRDKFFNENGYVIVIVDTRGSGASFGTRLSEYSPIQVLDASAVLDWVVEQKWSDGNVGSYGTSYTGTTAELLCATKHPSIKAVIPGWSDFDIYRSPVRPYGMLASSFIRKWGMYVKWLDRNRSFFLKSSVNPVHPDSLKPALKEHKDNLRVFKTTKMAAFRNADMGAFDYEECSVVHWKKEIEESNVPMLILASWMDAGTAEGAIQRLEHFSNPQKVLLMSTAHGGWCNASPFVVGDSLLYPRPRMANQNKTQLDFFDHYLKGTDKGVEDWPLVTYFNMGEEEFKRTDVWPLPNTTEANFYLQVESGLSKQKPTDSIAFDAYKVDFGVMTSKYNRWTTQMEGPVKNLNNRNEMDERMLVYTSEPMKEDLQITGTPVVNLQLSSSHADGAVFVYLEDVDEAGKSTYITEGGLHLIHRKQQIQDSTHYNMHSFNEEDSAPMIPGKTEEIAFKLWPTSVLIKKGHSLRVAIAGADKSTFDRLPKRGKPVLNVHRSSWSPSFVTLPIIEN